MFPKVFGAKKLLQKHLPILVWLPKYTAKDAISDAIAGITVGLTLMPQAIAYAALAGLGPQYGLYSGCAGVLVYIVFGSTRQIALGPTALLSLLTYHYTRGKSADYVVLLTFLVGCVELLCGILQLGFLVNFVSVPVISGFTSAAALIIASAQLKSLFGLRYNAESFIETWREFFKHNAETRLWDLTLGLFCIVTLMLLKKLNNIQLVGKGETLEGWRKTLKQIFWAISIGRNALIVVICSLLAYAYDQANVHPFVLTGEIQSGLPNIAPPPFQTLDENGETVGFLEMATDLGSGLLVIPLIAIVSNLALSKAFSDGGRTDATQEMIALGLANIVGSFVKSMPMCGAFSRSAVNNASGVRTTFGGLYTSILVLLALGVLTPYFYFIPRASLAAVIITAVLHMVDIDILKPIWSTNKYDLLPVAVTFFSCLLLGVEVGLLIGILMDLAFLLYHTAKPSINVERVVDTNCSYWMVIPRGSLLYPAVDHVRSKIFNKTFSKTEEGIQTRTIVFDCSHISKIDFTAAQGLQDMLKDIRNQKMQLVLLYANEEMVHSVKNLCPQLKVAMSQLELQTILAEDFVCEVILKTSTTEPIKQKILEETFKQKEETRF
ncbi:sodium-independent sulfate anion transporter [Nilaparvata lugens]|uniref:sodium-independent sulfate anion transporter n=1 Tax=Nilaparvata lugens TaxID=108931 RepID=UPI00193CAD07|nr:sodium-independent sulfate anion transporter [Nilaparvata lugens]XP_039290573.1 sodium-independent sulfate anion transporter [Nilaparvata lugens]